VLLALLFLVSLPAVTARLYSADEVQYFSYLRSLYFDGDVSFENEYRYFYERNIAQSPGYHETFLERETRVGRRVNYGTIGAGILWLPFYAAADVWARATGAAEANGLTQPYIAGVAYGSAFYGFLAVLLSARGAALILGRRRHPGGPLESDGEAIPFARVAGPALVVWVGTPLLFYMYVAPPFSHACSAFAVALFVNVWLHVRRRWTAGGAFALGLSAALVAMVREQDAFVALGPLVDFGVASFRSRRPTSRLRTPQPPTPDFQKGTGMAGAALAGLLGTLLGYAPQLLAYNALNGYPGPAEHVSRKMYWLSPWALNVLFSPHHGFFFWTPLAVLAFAGLFLLKDRMVAASLGIMAVSQVYVAGSVMSWTVAGAFGQRRFVCLTVVLIIGLAGLWNAVAPPRRALAGSAPREGARRLAAPGYAIVALVLLCAWWNVALMAQFATRLMDRQRLEPARNAYHAFVTLPLSVPSLGWRYLTDRDSFYDQRGIDERR
jgi:hypothetical protein